MHYVYRLAYVEPAWHPWDEAYLIVIDKLFDVLLLSVCQYLLKIFASMFIMDIGLKFSFLVESLPGWSHHPDTMIWEGFPLFGLFKIVLEGMVPAPPCVSGRIRP